MDANEYQKKAMEFLNNRLTNRDILEEGMLGLCSEAGEAAGAYKKIQFQGHGFSRHVIAIELGDVAWYLAEVAYALGYSLSEILQLNIAKLHARYPEGNFTIERSINREI